MLRIKDIAFEVDTGRSEFLAYLPQEQPGQQSSGRLCWSLEVFSVEKECEHGFCAPCLYVNEMTFDVRDWRMIEGRTVQNEGGEGLAAYLGVHESTLTSNNSIRFLSRRNNLFRIEWECLGDAYWDGDYSSGLPLWLNTEIVFNGVHSWWIKADSQGLAEVKALVGRHFDLACLEEPQITGPFHIVFPPRI